MSEEEIHKLCKTYNIENYTIQPDGSVDVDGDVSLSRLGFEKLPLKFGLVTGYFDCLNNQLTTLEGAPTSVGEHFDCNYNQLTNLEHFPEVVGESIYMTKNYLTSLEGLPKEVNGTLHCQYNRLTDLKGCPQKIDGSLQASDNQLTSLEGSPREVATEFNCSKNKLTSLEGCPDIVGRDFNFNKNYIYNLDGFDTEFSGKVFFLQNPIGLLLNPQDYDCIKLFKKIKVVVGKTLNLKRYKYLDSIYDFNMISNKNILPDYYEIN